MGQAVTPEDIRRLGHYSTVHVLACLPFVALGGFDVIPPWVFAAVAAPIGAVVGVFTLRPRRAGALAGAAGMLVAGLTSGALSAIGLVFDPAVLQDPRWTVGLGVGAVIGGFAGMYVWDVLRGEPPSRDDSLDSD